MRKIILGIIAVSLVVLTAAPAFAQHHHRRDHGYRQPQARHHYAPPRQHYHPPRQRQNNWVPYALGGLALGALGTGMYYYNSRPCWDEFVGYDRRGREVFQRYCQ